MMMSVDRDPDGLATHYRRLILMSAMLCTILPFIFISASLDGPIPLWLGVSTALTSLTVGVLTATSVLRAHRRRPSGAGDRPVSWWYLVGDMIWSALALIGLIFLIQLLF